MTTDGSRATDASAVTKVESSDPSDRTERLSPRALPVELVPVAPGERLDRYLVLEQIGRGGMAVVYKAFDPELDRNVAMKVMFPEDGSIHDAQVRSRFVREAQAMARISHPNVIEVYDVGLVGERAFIAMKLVDGCNLRELVREPGPWRERLAIYIKAGRGLAAAHAAGLVHRDFKASNVLVAKDGGVYVTDFGLARLATLEDDSPPVRSSPGGMLGSEITRAGAIAGTEGYIAPELYEGGAPNARSDQFSFCVALYAGLFGQAPFEPQEREPDAPLDARPKALVPQADPANSEVPAWVRKIVRRGLAIDPAKRWASMDDLLDALGRDPRARRRRWLIATGTVAALAATIVLVDHKASSRQQNLCAGAERNLDGVWDAQTRTTAEAAFKRSELPYAANSWSATSTALDTYATTWVAMRTEACTATRIRGEQADAVLSLRMLCLDRRLQELKALVSRLGLRTRASSRRVRRRPPG